jgi:hypothetical protein
MGLTLTVLLIVSVTMAAIIVLAFSHLDLAYVDQRYVDALYLAEAGLNYEIQEMNRSAVSGQYPPLHHIQPQTVTMDANRSFTVSSEEIGYGRFRVRSTGVSSEVSRTVQVVAGGRSALSGGPGQGWTLFGIETLDLDGSLTVGAGHPVATSGTAHIDNKVVLYGGLFLSGDKASANSPYDTSPRIPLETYPTVEVLANQLASALSGMAMSGQQGMDWLATHNDNAYMLDANGNQVILPHKTLDGAAFDSVPKVKGVSTIILKNPYTDGRAANFYLEGMDVSGGNNLLVIDNTLGPVAVWVGRSQTSLSPSANLNAGNVTFTAKDHARFKIYHGGAQDFNLHLDLKNEFFGDVYAVSGSALSGWTGAVNVTGGGSMTGSVVAYQLHRSGPTAGIVYPKAKGDAPPVVKSEPILFYSVTPGWTEVTP